MSDEGEIEVKMEASDDKKVITLAFTCTFPMNTRDFIMALETYLSDLTRSALQREGEGVNVH